MAAATTITPGDCLLVISETHIITVNVVSIKPRSAGATAGATAIKIETEKDVTRHEC